VREHFSQKKREEKSERTRTVDFRISINTRRRYRTDEITQCLLNGNRVYGAPSHYNRASKERKKKRESASK
jgi:hypothetical protein